MRKVEKFIKDFKQIFQEELESVFYNGYCYWFAHILAARFKGEIWFNPMIVHFAAKIGTNLYDVYGKVTPGVDPITGEYDELNDDWVEWGEYQRANQEQALQIVQSCIKKV